MEHRTKDLLTQLVLLILTAALAILVSALTIKTVDALDDWTPPWADTIKR
jgi:hypothetical protein